YDTLSPTPITQVMEWAHDTILALSTSGVYRGYDILIPFDTVTPEPGTQSTPTGAMMKDSTGAIYVAMSDGKLFITQDGANSWSEFDSPEEDSSAPIISMTASPNGLLFAADSNLATGYTRTWEYDPAKQTWKNVTSGLRRQGFPDTAEVTNIWYVNGYAYAGTWNMGLFRSLNPVDPGAGVETAEHHSSFSLYPNPASSLVTMTYPSFVSGTYRIIDMAGRELARGTIAPNSGKTTLDVRGFPDGLYEVTVGGGGWVPAKLVVNH
ncbi:MAG TPA: T9SS type A sorting domain-containing protein, partial [Candidatus Kapabacteria bacterium]|nr:T9SS type A sorting domain-containing protein [Candidatus Kapabacteria bacterium]